MGLVLLKIRAVPEMYRERIWRVRFCLAACIAGCLNGLECIEQGT